MTRRAQLPDGTVLEFPDETTDQVMDQVVGSHVARQRQETEARTRSGDPRVLGSVAGAMAGAALANPPQNVSPYTQARVRRARERGGRTQEEMRTGQLRGGGRDIPVPEVLRGPAQALQNFNRDSMAWQTQMPRNLGIADELAGASTFLGQGTENLIRRARGQEIEIPAMTAARAAADWENEEGARVRREQPGQDAIANAANIVAFAGTPAAAGPVTMLQAGLGAAGTNAPFALARQEGDFMERLPGAAQETALVFGLGAGLQGLGNAITRQPPRSGRLVNNADRLGIPPNLAMTGGPMERMGTKFVSESMLAGGRTRRALTRSMEGTRNAAQRTATSYGRVQEPEAAGTTVQQGLRRYGRNASLPNPQPTRAPLSVPTREWSRASKARAVFDEALRPIEDNVAELRNTSATLAELRRRADSRVVRDFKGDATLSSFEETVQRLTRAGRDSVGPASPEDLTVMAREIEEARRATGNADQSLSSWVRRRGGVKDDRGDIRGMDTRGVGASSVRNTRSGRSIDDLATAAWEDGFFPGDRPPTPREFLDALDQDTRQAGSVVRPDAQGANTQARQVLEYYERQGIDTNLTGQRLQRALRPLAGVDEAAGAGATLRDLRELRRKVREAQDGVSVAGQTPDNAALQRIEAALTEDIYAAAGPAAANLRRADAWYRRSKQRMDGLLETLAGDDVNPQAAYNQITRWATRRGANSKGLAALRSALRDDEWRSFVASYINHIGQPSAGASGMVTDIGFSVHNFARAYRDMTPQARRIFFGGPTGSAQNQLMRDLDDLAEIALSQKAIENMGTPSGRDFQNYATGAAAVTNLPMTVMGLMGMASAGELMVSPTFVRWLTSASQSGAGAGGMRRQLSQLAQIAARDPAVVPYYEAYLTQLEGPESPSPAMQQAGSE